MLVAVAVAELAMVFATVISRVGILVLPMVSATVGILVLLMVLATVALTIEVITLLMVLATVTLTVLVVATECPGLLVERFNGLDDLAAIGIVESLTFE